ncbi:MAG TPA: PadR family transcriptional regulator, partial [Candidatus Fusicatenibacter merdavium]|nr:PadR family transcriptional regulator [Candidatus Fusicatenibacter merdavium]
YVETYLVESDSGPARKYYHLTEKGYGYLEEKSKEWQAFTEMVDRLTRKGGYSHD